MDKKILAIAVLLMMLSLTACNTGLFPTKDKTPEASLGGDNQNSQETEEETVEEKNENGEFFFMAKVVDADQKKYLVAEIIDSDIAFGNYHVLVGDTTEYLDNEGNAITREDIKVGDTIEIIFSGQVMLSYPPQIAAIKIIKK